MAGTSLPCLPLFLIAAVVGGCAFGALVIGSLSAANRLAPPEARAQVISVYFVFAYAGLTVLVVGVAADYVGDFRAVLGWPIALAMLWALSAAGVVGPGRTGRPRGRVRAAAR